MSIVSYFLVSSQHFVEFDVFSNHNEIVHRPYHDNRCLPVNIITFIWLRTGSVVIDQQLHLFLNSLCKEQPRQLRQLYSKSGCPFLQEQKKICTGHTALPSLQDPRWLSCLGIGDFNQLPGEVMRLWTGRSRPTWWF